jgi:transcriptional regulator with XRE-family HTH domain
MVQAGTWQFSPELLRLALIDRGLSPVGVTDRTGVAFATIYGWLDGSHTPQARNLAIVAAELGVRPSDLYTVVDEDQVPA